jgi:hypothetical protein
MKRILFILTLALVALAGCKKDPAPEPDLPDTLQIADRTYEIGAACCYFTTGSEYTEYDLWFANKKLWTDVGNWPDDIDNSNGFEVNVYNLFVKGATPGEIASGTYTYLPNGEGNFVHDGFSDYGFYAENGNFNGYLEFGQGYVEESELVIEIKHISGNIYEIKFTGGVDVRGNPVSGYYKGEVDIFEE